MQTRSFHVWTRSPQMLHCAALGASTAAVAMARKASKASKEVVEAGARAARQAAKDHGATEDQAKKISVAEAGRVAAAPW